MSLVVLAATWLSTWVIERSDSSTGTVLGSLSRREPLYQSKKATRPEPALIAAATSYLTYVSIVGTAPVIPTLGARPTLEVTGLAGAVILGLLAGLSGRGFAWLVHRAKSYQETTNLPLRIAIAGVILGGLAGGEQPAGGGAVEAGIADDRVAVGL